jgi:hypothetical protein
MNELVTKNPDKDIHVSEPIAAAIGLLRFG